MTFLAPKLSLRDCYTKPAAMPQRKAELLDMQREGRTPAEAAELLGIPVNAVHQACKKYGIKLRRVR